MSTNRKLETHPTAAHRRAYLAARAVFRKLGLDAVDEAYRAAARAAAKGAR